MVLRRSIRIVVPHSLSDRPALAAAPDVFQFERTVGPQAQPVDPVLFSGRKPGASTDPAAACPDGTPPFRFPSHALDATPKFPDGSKVAPTRAPSKFNSQSGAVWPIIGTLQASRNQGRQALTPLPNRPAEWSFWNPSGSDRRDPNTLAPNRMKARTTPSRPSRISTSS